MRIPSRLIASISLGVLGVGVCQPAQAQTCVAPPAGIVGWWPGNGNANDAVAGNNGQLAGDAMFAPAVVAQGFKFDGVGDYVEIPDSLALKPAHMSVEAWVRFDSLDTPIVSQFGAPGLQYVVFKKNSRVFNFEAYALRKQRVAGVDRLAFSVADVNGFGGTSVAYSTTPVVVGQFYHVAGTYDGSYVRLYINGSLEGQSAVSVTVDYGTRPVFIGTSGETVFDGKLNGVVDEAAIYNRALDASEIAAVHAAGTAGKCGTQTLPTLTLTPSSLQFGVINSGGSVTSTTPAQALTLTQSGAGAVTWTVTRSQPWISVSPTSGTGPATLTVSINNIGGVLPATGSLAGTITVNTVGATNSPSAAVNLTVLAPSAATPAIGLIDTPTPGQSGISGSLAVTGWAIDDIGVSQVRILRAPVAGETPGVQVFIGNGVFVAGARPDIAALYPTRPLKDSGGWGYLMLTNFLPNLGTGTFTLYAYADDLEGHTTLLGSRTITCANSTATNPFGAIDTPRQGETVSGSVTNFGWVLSPGTRRADPPSGGAVNVFIDGAPVGVPLGWTSRPDLTALFPASQYAGIGSALGVFTFDSASLTNGVHTIAWGVTDNQGGAAGIGSRYFTVTTGSGLTLAASAQAALRAEARLDVSPLEGRRGFDLEEPFKTFTADAQGTLTIQAEAVDRVELRTNATAGFLRTPSGLSVLPFGSRLDENGTFTWQPGVAFIGAYDFVFESTRGTRQVRIVLNPKGSRRVGPQIVIDAPAATQDVTRSFTIAGWAADLDAGEGMGIELIHVWAYPVSRAAPIFLGIATLGGERPDVAAAYGERFIDSGYGLSVRDLPPGSYDVAVFAWSAVQGGFVPAKTVRVTVR